MFQHLKRLGTETAVYGISTILGRFLNFLLVPFYTNVLAPGEYGIVAYVYSLIAFINVFYSYGMETAYFKYSSTLEIGTTKQNFSTPFISLFGTSIFFSFLIFILSSSIVKIIAIPAQYDSIILYTAGILAFDCIAIIPFASLRMEHKAKLFALIKFSNIVINVGMNLILLLMFKMGVVGVFISGFIASTATLLMLTPIIIKHFTIEFNLPLWKSLLKFSLPYVPSGLASMVIQVVDRPILRSITDDATVGIYQANYRLGIFMMLIVSMYDYAWRPFYFSTAKEPDAKDIFARVLTYLVLIMSTVFLIITFFIEDIVKINIFGRYIIGQNYWVGLNIVPVVLLGYLFLGISSNLSAGMYIEKKTKYSPLITGVGALVNITANFLLIPIFGMMGAAIATLLAYISMTIMMYFVVQRIYPISYEFERLFKIFLAVGIVLIVYYFVPIEVLSNSKIIVIVWKLALLISFSSLFYLMKFFNPDEKVKLKQIFGKIRNGGLSTSSNDSINSNP